MSRIDDLIKDLCPDGVAIERLGNVAQYVRGVTYSKNDEVNTGGVGILRSNNIDVKKSTIDLSNLKTIRSDAKLKESQRLIKGDILMSAASGSREHVGKVAYVFEDTELYFGGFMAVIRSSPGLESRFLFHVLTSNNFSIYLEQAITSTTINNLNASIINEFQLQVPPIEVQREIVSILDKFTELEAELEAELEVRRKQYEHYQQRLLSFDVQSGSGIINELIALHCPNGVEFKTLGDLLNSIPRGKRLTKSNLAQDGSIPVFHGGLDPIGFHDQSNTPGMTVMVINTGASSGTVGWSEKPFWCSDGCFALPHTNELSSRYLYYCMLLNQQFFVDRVRKAGIPTLAAESVLALSIPVPDIIVQLEIVKTLDEFQSLVKDVSFGLPAEIMARRKQYEYYRDKLLTFKELEVA